MKSLAYAIIAASALSIPVASFAQASSNGPVTRSQVRQELIQLEQAGYNPAAHNDPSYPNDIQAAEARVQSQQGTAVAAGETSGYGGVAAGSSQSGASVRMQPANTSNSLYSGH